MRAVQQRTFIAIDEWLGIAVAIFLHETGSSLFWPFVVLWAVAVYAISYPWYWWSTRKAGAEPAAGDTVAACTTPSKRSG